VRLCGHLRQQRVGVRQQPVHLGFEPALNESRRVVGSAGQIRVGNSGFTVDPEVKTCGSREVHNSNIEVEEVHLMMFAPVKLGRVNRVLSRWRALPFRFYVVVCVAETFTEATWLSGRARPSQKNVVSVFLECWQNLLITQPDHQNRSIRC
jgi:hypothetical protein